MIAISQGTVMTLEYYGRQYPGTVSRVSWSNGIRKPGRMPCDLVKIAELGAAVTAYEGIARVLLGEA